MKMILREADEIIDDVFPKSNEWFHNHIRDTLKEAINKARKETIETCAEISMSSLGKVNILSLINELK